MGLVVYLDETGDHSLGAEDESFPIFAIVMLVCDTRIYNHRIVPKVNELKQDFCGNTDVILHSRDIRRAQGNFTFLRDRAQRHDFYERINAIMSENFQLIGCAIRKREHRERYGTWAKNPYHLSLTFTLERLVTLLKDAGEQKVQIIAEARGKREDNALYETFKRTIRHGTQFVPAQRFKAIHFSLRFAPKSRNIIGTQLADLAAYPFARFALNPEAPNPAYEIIQKRFYTRNGTVLGCKIFP